MERYLPHARVYGRLMKPYLDAPGRPLINPKMTMRGTLFTKPTAAPKPLPKMQVQTRLF